MSRFFKKKGCRHFALVKSSNNNGKQAVHVLDNETMQEFLGARLIETKDGMATIQVPLDFVRFVGEDEAETICKMLKAQKQPRVTAEEV